MKSKRVEIDYDGRKYVYIVREVTWGEMSEVARKCISKIKVLGGEFPQVEIDLVEWITQIVSKAVRNEDGTEIDVNNIPTTIFRILSEHVLELNPFPTLFSQA